jgi:hypothetical protein
LSLGSTSERGATSSNLRWVGYSQLSAVAVMVDVGFGWLSGEKERECVCAQGM